MTFTTFDLADIPAEASNPLHSDISESRSLCEEIPPVDSDSLVGYYNSFCTIA